MERCLHCRSENASKFNELCFRAQSPFAGAQAPLCSVRVAHCCGESKERAEHHQHLVADAHHAARLALRTVAACFGSSTCSVSPATSHLPTSSFSNRSRFKLADVELRAPPVGGLEVVAIETEKEEEPARDDQRRVRPMPPRHSRHGAVPSHRFLRR